MGVLTRGSGAARDVGHPRKRPVLDVVVREQLLDLEARSQYRGAQVVRRAAGLELPVVAQVGGDVVVHVIAEPRAECEAQVEVVIGHVRRKPEHPVRRRVMEGSDRKSTRLNSSHSQISYAVFCLKKKKESSYSILPDSCLSASRSKSPLHYTLVHSIWCFL